MDKSSTALILTDEGTSSDGSSMHVISSWIISLFHASMLPWFHTKMEGLVFFTFMHELIYFSLINKVPPRVFVLGGGGFQNRSSKGEEL